MNPRAATIQRVTNETSTHLVLSLDEPAPPSITTGLGFLDHMLTAFAFHARLGLELRCTGDSHIDDHHTVEDCAIALGQAIDRALSDRAGIRRFASAYCPLDESLARAVIDLAARPHATVNLALRRDRIGEVACENLTHFFVSFAAAARLTLHLDVIRGENDHHKAEASFKSFALALREAVAIDPRSSGVPSTKGTLT